MACTLQEKLLSCALILLRDGQPSPNSPANYYLTGPTSPTWPAWPLLNPIHMHTHLLLYTAANTPPPMTATVENARDY
ncbi:hypothetical protein LZ32DRAFT_610026 [Colletotrichum eremochloae]|nr:hypothetical protein LZ32DRAFT_610026 [Colletotrichum eremochloae]